MSDATTSNGAAAAPAASDKKMAEPVRTAVINVSNVVADVVMVGEHGWEHPDAGVTLVASATAQIGQLYDPKSGVFSDAPAAPEKPANIGQLLGALELAASAARRVVVQRVVSAPGASPVVSVGCDTTQATIDDLKQLRDWGAAAPNDSQNWADVNWDTTLLTGAEFVRLAQAAFDCKGRIFALCSATAADIKAGKITMLSTIAGLAWPLQG